MSVSLGVATPPELTGWVAVATFSQTLPKGSLSHFTWLGIGFFVAVVQGACVDIQVLMDACTVPLRTVEMAVNQV